MAFTYLTNVPLEQAKKDYLRVLAEQGFSARTERIRVQDAFGRITAKAVYAHINAPHYACSAMDGIALFAKDSFGATETTPVTLREGQFTVVDTGDPIPEGCDAVIMVEEIVRNEDGSVTIHAPAAPWQHIRQIGEDVCAGEMILPGLMEITPAAIGAMIAGGILEVEVLAKPVVGIIPTGDEIVPPCSDPKPGDIMEFNSSIFSAMLSSWGAEARTYPIVPDRYDEIRGMLEKAVSECDLVILNAGSGGLVSTYMVNTQILHLKNTYWALILPGMCSTWYLMILRNYFRTSVPDSLIEAGKMEGVSPIQSLSFIVIPICKPVVMTVAVFQIFAYWNSWYPALIYIDSNHRELYPLQYVLVNIERTIKAMTRDAANLSGMNNVTLPSTAMRMALVVVTILPIMVLFPFFQRFLKTGMAIGAVKE